MEAMTPTEQAEQARIAQEIERAALALRRSGCEDEDVVVALARIENWLTENEGRWTR